MMRWLVSSEWAMPPTGTLGHMAAAAIVRRLLREPLGEWYPATVFGMASPALIAMEGGLFRFGGRRVDLVARPASELATARPVAQTHLHRRVLPPARHFQAAAH